MKSIKNEDRGVTRVYISRGNPTCLSLKVPRTTGSGRLSVLKIFKNPSFKAESLQFSNSLSFQWNWHFEFVKSLNFCFFIHWGALKAGLSAVLYFRGSGERYAP